MDVRPNRPHSSSLRRGRTSLPQQVYHITTTTRRRLPLFKNLWLGRCVVQALQGANIQAETLVFVLMPDHLHWLVQLREEFSLSQVVGGVKSVSSRKIAALTGNAGTVWQDGFHDHAVRDEESIQDIAEYVLTNPIRAGVARSLARYPLWDAYWL